MGSKEEKEEEKKVDLYMPNESPVNPTGDCEGHASKGDEKLSLGRKRTYQEAMGDNASDGDGSQAKSLADGSNRSQKRLKLDPVEDGESKEVQDPVDVKG